jgi:hypothetical protein
MPTLALPAALAVALPAIVEPVAPASANTVVELANLTLRSSRSASS